MANSRVVSIDVLRGITIAAMLLVNDPGDADNVFATLRHSTWNGATFADFVFPFFLFLVGVTTHLSQSRRGVDDNDAVARRAIFKRAAILFAFGMFLNAYPFYEKSVVAGPEWLPAFFGHVVARFASVRIMGVLQRISITYLIVALTTRKLSVRSVIAANVVLLIGYWGALTLLPVPGQVGLGAQYLNDPARNLAAWVDRTVLDWTPIGLGWHLYDPALPYDPEGILSTIPSIATVLLGVLAGRWMQSGRAIVVGLIWNLMPINKLGERLSNYKEWKLGHSCRHQRNCSRR